MNEKRVRLTPSDNSQAGRRELDQLCRFAATLGTTLDVDTLVEDSLEPLKTMASADRIMIAISRNDARVLVPLAQSPDWILHEGSKGFPAPPVAALGTESRGFASIAELPPAVSSRLPELKGPIAAVPLWAHAHLRGLIILQRDNVPFTSHTLKLLTSSGRQLALAVENSQLLADLQDSYRKLMDTQEELIRSERLAVLGQLSATLAHEIRNPLATIFSAISQIRKHSKAEGVSATLLDIAEEEAVRLNRMVAGLLEFARPRKPVFEEDSLLDLTRWAIEGLRDRVALEEMGIHVSLHADSVTAPAQFDRELITRALELVLANAVAALEEEGGAIEATVSATEKGFCISISDNGVGIPPEQKARIFEPFFSTRPSGTGLGLPTVRRIMEDHRGRVEIVSEPGTGTTVRLLFTKRDGIPFE